jgi:3-aminobutyryl-CoA ammonia-lyase
MLEQRGFLRLRLSQLETHYLGGRISNAALARIMTDCSSQIGALQDGTDGYLAAFEDLEFFGAAYAGDYIEVDAWLTARGNRSRRTAVEARRVIRAGEDPFAGRALPEPELIARGTVVGVVPREAADLSGASTILDPRRHPGGDVGFLRVRVNNLETHYLGGLLAGASLTRMMADCASEVSIRRDGRLGEFSKFERVDILAPVYAGDVLELSAAVVDQPAGGLRIAVQAGRVLRAVEQPGGLSGGEPSDPPQPVGRAIFVVTTGAS